MQIRPINYLTNSINFKAIEEIRCKEYFNPEKSPADAKYLLAVLEDKDVQSVAKDYDFTIDLLRGPSLDGVYIGFNPLYPGDKSALTARFNNSKFENLLDKTNEIEEDDYDNVNEEELKILNEQIAKYKIPIIYSLSD